MAEEGSKVVDVKEFEKMLEQVTKDETGADWNLAKSFEHTTVYRRTDNDSIFKVSITSAGIFYQSRSVYVHPTARE